MATGMAWQVGKQTVSLGVNYESISACLAEIYFEDNDFDADSCTTARGLHVFLLEFNTVFLLKIFAAIFSHTDILYQVL